MRLLLATENPHKLREMTALLAEVPQLEVVSLRNFPHLKLPPETGTTMRENARIKAEYCTGATGLTSLADDSGIEVDALGGEPGVYSARWFPGTDEQRTQALLDRLRDVPDEQRTARYRCAVCVGWIAPASPEVRINEVEATCEGRITHAFRGSNGFGYDPIFELTSASGAPSEWIGCTMAEAPPELKAQISHRARAVRLAVPHVLRLAEA